MRKDGDFGHLVLPENLDKLGRRERLLLAP